MKPLRRYINEQVKKSSTFAKELDAAEADVCLAIELARGREQRGLTQRQLAARAGMKQPQIARLEQGGSLPNVSTLLCLLEILGVRLEIGPDRSCRIRLIKAPSTPRRKILSHA